ncbi:zinc-binding dehydrogenase [Prescottella sp. R16]|uniref:zinc-binding dehydrogenase n=1 Tax=Prescottella sp. R16 TaxID=3064529 RepID=UPI00272E9EC5|nr:zinc-binding dehydrogenase [Prescottella sp. R16]
MTSRVARVVVQDMTNGPLEVREVALPAPGPHQVRVEVQASGVCRSSLTWMKKERPNPMLLGHEAVGVVVEAGAEVRNVSEGDPVLITWIPARDPEGRLPEQALIARKDGPDWLSPQIYTWADHVLLDSLYVMKLPKEAASNEISIVGCAVPTGAGVVTDTVPVGPQSTVVVIGIGGIGTTAIAGAAASSAGRIVAVDVSHQKLDFATRLGATDVVNASEVDPVSAVHRLLADHPLGTGADLVIDCVGAPATVSQAVAMARNGIAGLGRGGDVALVGIPPSAVEVDVTDMLWNQKSLIGTLGGTCTQDSLRRFCDWHTTGRLDVGQLVTDTYKFEEIQEAVTALEEGRVLGRAIIVT